MPGPAHAFEEIHPLIHIAERASEEIGGKDAPPRPSSESARMLRPMSSKKPFTASKAKCPPCY